MGGPAKNRSQKEKPSSASTNESSGQSVPRFDGNRDPNLDFRRPGESAVEYPKATDLKNISEFLGIGGWYTARGVAVPSSLPQRPKQFNQYGKETTVMLNTFNVIKAPTTIAHQYDVVYSGDGKDYTKRVLLKKIWNSKKVKAELGEPKHLWIWDGNKLAWSGRRLDRDETRISVDLDDEEGKPTKPGQRGNKHTVHLRWTRQVDFNHLNAFLNGQTTWSTECVDTINFLDHVMREHPSQKYTQIKKSFFQRGEKRYDLGKGVEAFKGVFASLRPVLDNKGGKSLAVNIDVANGTFWHHQPLPAALCQMFGVAPPALIQLYKEGKKNWKESRFRKDVRPLKRVGVTASHTKAQFTIDDIIDKDATEMKFPDPDDRREGVPDSQRNQITIAKYFKDKYKINCMPGLPVVKMTKRIRGQQIHLPMDVLVIDENQRYNTKLNDTQTSAMIKFAVTLPKERWAAVQHGVGLLNWASDPYLKHYGLQVNPNASKVKARVLPPPTVHFGAGSKEATISPKDLIQGRWRLDGRKFAINNKERPIKGWGVCVVTGRGNSPPPAAVDQFVAKLVQIYEGHGGVFAPHPTHGKKPWVGTGHLSDGGELVANAWNKTGNRYNAPPMFMVFIINDRNIELYRRIKKSCDNRFGVASQVLQSRHVLTASPQYISNVCMKINAKLGGATTIVKSTLIPKIAPKSASIPTMVVGADVSHPAPGAPSVESASFAAITVSADQHFAKYWAECQTNGNRVEMITTHNIIQHFGAMVKLWMQRVGQGRPPKRVLYIRDGVSEGQYAAVLEEEVRDMKETFKRQGCQEIPKITVVIAGKRHHIRFFPDSGSGDRNGNPLPGTLVEAGCTHPFEFDFYLCSHVAIKGTARPIHYQCILNEGEWQPAELQQFIFEQSYQYVRSTTPVSLHPAVYYAHLAADRSHAHTVASPVSSGKKEAKAAAAAAAGELESSTGTTKKRHVEVAPLLAIQNARGLKDVMWYV